MPMLVTLSGIVISVIFVQFLNAEDGIVVAVFPMITVFNDEGI